MNLTKTCDVIGLGNATLDILMLVDELPGGELVQPAKHTVLQGGGPVATAMSTLARLGARTAMIDRLGDDWRGDHIVAGFNAEGVNTEMVRQAAGKQSGLSNVLVRERDGARAITFSRGTAPALSPDDVPADWIRGSRVLHLNGRHLDACFFAAGVIHQSGGKVSFDGGAHRYRAEIRPLVQVVDYCITALDFAQRYTGFQSVEKTAEALLAEGPELVVLTNGTAGSWVFVHSGEAFHQPAFMIDPVVDTTGAGDAYHGGFIYGLLQDWPLTQTARFASAVGGMNTRALGGRTALPTRDEVEFFLRGNPSIY